MGHYVVVVVSGGVRDRYAAGSSLDFGVCGCIKLCTLMI